MEKSLTEITQESYELYWTSPGGNTPQTTVVRPLTTYHKKLYKLDEPDMQDTAGEVRMNS